MSNMKIFLFVFNAYLNKQIIINKLLSLKLQALRRGKLHYCMHLFICFFNQLNLENFVFFILHYIILMIRHKNNDKQVKKTTCTLYNNKY